MTGDWAAALESTILASTLRGSTWAYPLVNTGHILGVALLVGAIVPLDLRLMGVWKSLPLAPLWRVLTRSAGVGLGLAVFFGALLFITRATVYAQSPLFIAKMALVSIGAANAVVSNLTVPNELLLSQSVNARLPGRVRFASCISLAAWSTALLLGRLVGYFSG